MKLSGDFFEDRDYTVVLRDYRTEDALSVRQVFYTVNPDAASNLSPHASEFAATAVLFYEDSLVGYCTESLVVALPDRGGVRFSEALQAAQKMHEAHLEREALEGRNRG